MAFNQSRPRKAESHAYVIAPTYDNAQVMLDELSQNLEENSYRDFDEEDPGAVYDQNVFKVTITVEQV